MLKNEESANHEMESINNIQRSDYLEDGEPRKIRTISLRIQKLKICKTENQPMAGFLMGKIVYFFAIAS
jgi:hypothetical protein